MRGRHRAPSKAVPIAAATASAGIAGALVMSGTIAAQAQAVAQRPLPADAASSLPDALTLGALRHLQPASPEVTVQPGDTLSAISAANCGTPLDWTRIYDRNRRIISNPDVIFPGQKFVLDCRRGTWTPQRMTVAAVSVSTGEVTGTVAVSSGEGFVNPVGYSGFQACVIRAESGGNSQVWNASGHYGLYQFSSSTWAAHGGNPADFGHASAAEQTQVFWNTVHADGGSDWSPYDGCPF